MSLVASHVMFDVFRKEYAILLLHLENQTEWPRLAEVTVDPKSLLSLVLSNFEHRGRRGTAAFLRVESI